MKSYSALTILICLAQVASADSLPTDIPSKKWTRFAAPGYSKPACGMVFTDKDTVPAGMSLGGLGTGCLDIETSGTIGFSSIFYPSIMVEPTPYQTLRNKQWLAPFLGFTVGDDVYVLASEKIINGGTFEGCVDPVDPGNYRDNETYMSHWRVELAETKGVEHAKEIRYWGHYPIVDIDYETAAPVDVSLRAWSPFLPGKAQESGTPAAMFEVTLTNNAAETVHGKLVFTFPGPTEQECGEASQVSRTNGSVECGPVSYAVIVANHTGDQVHYGRHLKPGTDDWSNVAKSLPSASEGDRGLSCAVEYHLSAGQTKTIRFALGWQIKKWTGGAYQEIKHFDETWAKNEFTLEKFRPDERSQYTPKYTEWFDSAKSAAQHLVDRGESTLKRIIGWQEEVYGDESLPVWLRSELVNNLALFAEDSLWARAEGDIAEWSAPLGAFQMIECPRTCAIVGCIASNYYGDLPIAYFFPELERQILRGYAAYVRPDGAVPFLYPPNDFTKACYEWQIGLNGACFADLVHRLWLRTSDDSVVKEFYPVVKKNTEFTVNLATGEHGLISFHREGNGQEWWEHTPVYGMVTHLAGVRLAQLRFARRMAHAMNDQEFTKKCDVWIAQASKLMEENLWNDKTKSYDFYRYPAKDMFSADIMSSQLDGQWMVDLHGLEPVFQRDRIEMALQTIKRTCLVDNGLAGFADPEKGPDLARYGTFPPEVNIVAMTYMYNGDPELGLEIARRNMDNIIRVQGLGWDMPNLIRCDTGARTYGADYYQNMVLWGLPAAIHQQDLSGPCKKGGLVARMMEPE